MGLVRLAAAGCPEYSGARVVGHEALEEATLEIVVTHTRARVYTHTHTHTHTHTQTGGRGGFVLHYTHTHTH